MGCCSSVPANEAKPSQQQGTSKNNNANRKSRSIDNSEEKLKRSSTSSLNLDNGEKKNEKRNSRKTWPIFVRLSHNGQDIKVEAPIDPPYLTIASLRQQLIPHLNNFNNSKNNVKLIYLGRILNNKQTIVPTVTDEDMPLPPPKNNTIQIQKNGVIQAMVSKV